MSETNEETAYLATLLPGELQRLYGESELKAGEIDGDYIAGYWAYWTGWPRPATFPEAAEGWDDAYQDRML